MNQHMKITIFPAKKTDLKINQDGIINMVLIPENRGGNNRSKTGKWKGNLKRIKLVLAANNIKFFEAEISVLNFPKSGRALVKYPNSNNFLAYG